MTEPLAVNAISGARVTAAVQVVRFVLQTVGLVVLSRMLSPSDFGLVALVTAILGVADVLRDMGLSSAAVQAPALAHQQATNLFWLNLLFGGALAAVAIACAPLVAAVGHDPRLTSLMGALTLPILFSAAQAQSQAAMLRDLRFATVALTDAAAAAVGLGVAVALAAVGWGIWALALQSITQALVLLVTRVSLAGFRPGLPRRGVDMQDLVKFGFNLAGTQLLAFLSANIDSIVMGTRFGAEPLGYYKRASQLVSLPLVQVMSPLTSVAFPSLARFQGQRKVFWSYFRRAQIAATYPLAIVLALVGLNADWLVWLIFGGGWTGSAVLVSTLAYGAVVQVVTYPAYWAFLALGRTDSHLRLSLVTRSLQIVCILVGSIFSPLAIAIGYICGALISAPVSHLWLARSTKVSAREISGVPTRVLLLAFSAMGFGEVVESSLRVAAPSGPLASLAACSLILGISVVSRTIRTEIRFAARSLLKFTRRAAVTEDSSS